MSFTVHNIPFWLKPFLFIFSWLGAFFFLSLNFFFRLTCEIEYKGKEHVESCPNHIFSIWHENVALFFIVHKYFHKPNIFLAFPVWFMAPTHVMNNFIGVKEMAFGGSGYDGKAALDKVVKRLRQGWSTFITPDGPSGPLKKIKKGVILMSNQGNTPIIPISFHLSKEYRINSWDRKRYPLPFAKITVCYKTPIWVKDERFEFYQQRLAKEMDESIK